MSRSLFALAVIGLCCCAAPAAAQPMPGMDMGGAMPLDYDVLKGPWTSIADLVSKKNGTSMLWQAIMAAESVLGMDVMAMLEDNSTVATLFAPTDEAIEALGAEALDALLANPAGLADILKYHIVLGEALTLADIIAMEGMPMATALEGQDIGFKAAGKKATVATTTEQKVPIYQYNMKAGSAVVHSIKEVMIPGDKPLFAQPPAAGPARR